MIGITSSPAWATLTASVPRPQSPPWLGAALEATNSVAPLCTPPTLSFALSMTPKISLTCGHVNTVVSMASVAGGALPTLAHFHRPLLDAMPYPNFGQAIILPTGYKARSGDPTLKPIGQTQILWTWDSGRGSFPHVPPIGSKSRIASSSSVTL
eukprot:2319544-Amphidinium_carterae.1